VFLLTSATAGSSGAGLCGGVCGRRSSLSQGCGIVPPALPIHVYNTATSRPVAVLVRRGKTPSGIEVRGHLRRLVRRIRRHWPQTRITIRGDGHYCARGQAENLIKLHKAQLASDRTGCRSPLANQMQLILHTAAYHGGPGIVPITWLEATYSGTYPHVPQNARGMQRLFKQLSFPGGIQSHAAPEPPGSIHEDMPGSQRMALVPDWAFEPLKTGSPRPPRLDQVDRQRSCHPP